MRAFLDTNILAYRVDGDEPEKQAAAAKALDTDFELIVSTQVLVELHSVLTRRFGWPREDAAEALDVLSYPVIATDRDLVTRAAATASGLQLSIFDALIVEAAAAASCDELWTEDLSDGQLVRGVRVVNPLAGN